jgi:hypothetical protein
VGVKWAVGAYSEGSEPCRLDTESGVRSQESGVRGETSLAVTEVIG